MFDLVFTEEFEKNFDKLKDKETQRRIYKRILDLKENPEHGRMLTGIRDNQFGRIYRLRIGKSRIIYAIKHETNEIILITLGHRESVYDRM
jgi:mRNA-degrading endonuclease RelE of RelBE toxin-antitoxin system